MDKTSQLAQLKDIHLPGPIPWWPLAPGWYALIVLAALLGFILLGCAYKRYKNALPKKQALELLDTYKNQYLKDKNAALMCARVSEILRRVALVYYPRNEVASLHGQQWVDFLNHTSSKVDFTPVADLLLTAPFKSGERINAEPLITRARLWIRQRRVRCFK